jgi:NADPH:quinone reductase-like Zn-dependent oxidoreductase
MQAVTNDHYGSPQVLTWSEAARPQVGPRDVLIRVHSTTVTQGDRRLRAADYPGVTRVLGRLFSGVFRPRHRIGGSTFAGRVVQVGDEVTRFSVGDDVFGGTMHGAYAEYLAVRDDSAVERMPDSTGYAEAAVLPYGGGTALFFLRDLARVQPGERVLIVGASGGVGRLAVQVARHLGAHVTAVCSAEAAELVQRLGAHEVIDYRAQNYLESGARWDVVFNTLEGEHFRAVRKVLSDKGRYLTLYVSLRVLFEMLTSKLFGGPRALVGVAVGSAKILSELRSLADAGALRDVIARRFPLQRADAAHAFLEDQRPHGSVVLDVIGGAAERKAPPAPLAAAS